MIDLKIAAAVAQFFWIEGRCLARSYEAWRSGAIARSTIEAKVDAISP